MLSLKDNTSIIISFLICFVNSIRHPYSAYRSIHPSVRKNKIILQLIIDLCVHIRPIMSSYFDSALKVKLELYFSLIFVVQPHSSVRERKNSFAVNYTCLCSY
jgi:hypothetical protein